MHAAPGERPRLSNDRSTAVAIAATTAPLPLVRPTRLGMLQARVGRRLLRLIGTKLFRFTFDLDGLKRVPPGEPLIVAAGPHRGWLDSFLLIMALPVTPRLYYLGSAEAMFNTWWKRRLLGLFGGVVPVSTLGQLNREGLETSLAILAGGNSLGVFPEGAGQIDHAESELGPLKRGVAFLSQRSGRRVLPVGLAGTRRLWRGKTVALRVGPPLAAVTPGAGRIEQQAYVDQLAAAIQAVIPALAPPPPNERRRWQWLTRMLG
ncbi:MAG: 1-acyl-sn-glycerol-3-phosphate acyltransferase [Chloroflexota bacterium]|nr:1-acyl-sn-glycerol-3-phosphate acyltransferase [Chloroflexota bacterium]